MNYRIAAVFVAVAAIVASAAIYFGEPFETVNTCYAANGAETSCSGEIVATRDDRDEDLSLIHI